MFKWQTLLISSLTALGAVAASPRSADAYIIYRHCEAHYRVHPHVAAYDDIETDTFQGRGGCGHRDKEKCKRRAREHVQACMVAHWSARNANATPAECDERAGVISYEILNLDETIRTNICQKYHPNLPIQVTVEAVTEGHPECEQVLTLSNNYSINCP